MIKRNINLVIKLLLVIFLIVLLTIISCIAHSTEQQVEAKVAKVEPVALNAEPVVCQDVCCCALESVCEYQDKIKKWEEEHYYATKVWEHLRQRGFSQEVTCAIIGNMMIETSGGSLDLNPDIYSPSGNYYGLCQWSKKYYPEAHGLSFKQQLEFLLNSIEWEINTFGKCYKEGFKYEDFLNMTDPAEAALAFAKSYERCSSVSYEMRQEAALKAYNYFDLDS